MKLLKSKEDFFYIGIISILVIILSIYAISVYGSADIDGKKYFFLDDDMMISMRYAKNLANGEGFSYNPQKFFNKDEPIEGYSNFLWTILMAIVHLFHISKNLISLVMQLINMFLLFLVCFAIYIIMRMLTNPLMGFLTVLIYLVFPGHRFFISGGFEVYAESLVILFFIFYLLKEDYFKASISIGLLPLLHTKNYLFSLVCLMALFIIETKKSGLKQASTMLLISIIPIFIHILFRLAYYKELLPNTYYLKVVGMKNLHLIGLQYVRNYVSLVRYLLIIIFAGLFIKPNKTRTLLICLFIVYAIFIVLMGGDIFIHNRFFLPVASLLIIAAMSFICDLFENEMNKKILPQTVKYLIVLFLLFHFFSIGKYSYNKVEIFLKKMNIQFVCRGIAFSEGIKKDVKIAVFGAGITPYFSEKQCIDMLGKADKHIARLKPKEGKVGHNKYDFDYIMSLEPDYVECHVYPNKVMDTKYLMDMVSKNPFFPFTFLLAENSSFRKKYARNGVKDKSGYFIHYYSKEKFIIPNIPLEDKQNETYKYD